MQWDGTTNPGVMPPLLNHLDKLGICQTWRLADVNLEPLATADKHLRQWCRHPVWQSSLPMRNREPEPVLGVDVHLDHPSGPVPRESSAAVRPVSAAAAFRAVTTAAALLCTALLACLVASPAGAAPELNWRTAEIDGTALTGVSCASASLCVAVDGLGDALVSTNPAADSASTWHAAGTGAGALTGVSCPSSSLCVAVNGEGRVAISTNPVGGGPTWHATKISGAALTGVSCASNSLCVAVDASGNAFVSSNPGEGAGGGASWRENPIGHALTAVSCVAGPLCVAVDKAGDVLESSEPAGSWITRKVDNAPLVAVSCASAPAGVCVAEDETGAALASGNPSAGLPGLSMATWSATPLASTGGAPTAASCAATGLCVLGTSNGGAYIGDSPTTAAPSWRFEPIDSLASLAGVSCVSEGLCAAVDKAGRVLVAHVPAPAIVTGTPSAVGETTATVTGTVDTNDAAIAGCRFEYGTSEAYGQSTPCSSSLAAGSANQPVSAALSGLAANATYDYRLTAVSASGEARTTNATFKTSSPPLVQPHPSIGGIPAPGQRLTCKSGVSGSGASSATLSYAWLRDTRAISGASGSTYVVASADVTHHLQCRVTATNAGGSASATSAFVTVPAGGIGAISETQVGTPRVAGRTVSVPLTCSGQAAGSCTIAVRLTVLETLRGNRVIAVAARRTARLASAAAARRSSRKTKTVTVGAVTVHVPAGQRRTVTVALNTTGRRLLASLHKLTAKLSVSGTVVGAISAQLRSATVTLGAGTGKASSHHRR
jgi:hypothetical protein